MLHKNSFELMDPVKGSIKKNSCEGDKLLNSSERFMPDLVDGNTIKKSLSTPPRTRNKFATFLQRKNEESGAVVVPGTRSRYSYIYRMLCVCCIIYPVGIYFNCLE